MRYELEQLQELSAAYSVPLLDVFLIALNLYGIASNVGDGRARMEVRFHESPNAEWHVIVPTGRAISSYDFVGEALAVSGSRVGSVRLIQHDDAQLGYVRLGGQVLTLNTNRRSNCTGCVFCPNTLADASDPRVVESTGEVEQWLIAFMFEHGWSDLSAIREINLSTGCFGDESRALAHLTVLRNLLSKHGFSGRLGILSSVIRSDQAMRALSALRPFALFLTLECITRRNVLLKKSKAELEPQEAIRVLARARSADIDTGVMIVVGLDPLPEILKWLNNATPFLTDFPNLQIFQSHSSFMDYFRVQGAESLEFFLQARRDLESVLLSTALRPRRWQNYRPLWYYTFGAETLPVVA